MVILTLLAYGCYKEKQKEELKKKNLLEKEDGESEQLELDTIERELDQLKDDDPDDYNYDYGDPENMDKDKVDKKFTDDLKQHLQFHEENHALARPSSPKSNFGAIRKPEKRVSPQRFPYKVHPYFPRPPPPFHYQPSFDQRSHPKEPRYYNQGYHQRYQPYPDHQRPYNQEPPRYDYYYHNNNNY